MTETNIPSIKRNFFYYTIFQILTVIVPFITAPYLSRILGAERIGIQSYTESVVAYFSMFAVLGTATYGTREVAINRGDKIRASQIFWEIETLKLIIGSVVLAGWVVFIFFSDAYRIYYTVLTVELVSVLFDITWFFNGFEQIGFIVVRNGIIKMLNVAAIFILVKKQDDLLLYIAITALSKFVSSICTYAYLPKFLVKTKNLNFWSNIKIHFRETIIYFIPAISTSVYQILDKILIGLIVKEPAQNGYYEQSERLVDMVKQVVFASMNLVMGVRNSYLFGQKKFREIKQKIALSMNYIMFMGVACGFGIVAVAARFVPLFYGEGYGQVVYILYIFAALPAIVGISSCLGSQYFNPVGKRKQSAIYIIIGSVINLVLNLILIPRLASYGAAIATVIAEIVISSLYVAKSDSFMTFLILFRIVWKKFLAGVVMFCALFAFGRTVNLSDGVMVSMQIVIGILIYPISLLLLKDEFLIFFIKKIASRTCKGMYK